MLGSSSLVLLLAVWGVASCIASMLTWTAPVRPLARFLWALATLASFALSGVLGLSVFTYLVFLGADALSAEMSLALMLGSAAAQATIATWTTARVTVLAVPLPRLFRCAFPRLRPASQA